MNIQFSFILTRSPDELHRYQYNPGIFHWSYDHHLKQETEKKINSYGKVITDLDVLVFVVNITHRHCQVIAVFADKKKIEVFDSLGSANLESCQAVWYFIVEVYQCDLDEAIDRLEWQIYFGRDYILK